MNLNLPLALAAKSVRQFAYLILFLSIAVQANLKKAELYIFDWDGTVVEDRNVYKGAHQVPFVLFRINYKGTAYQPDILGPDEIEISYNDYERLTRGTYDPITREHIDPLLLARGEGKLGSIQEFTLEDGRKIIPGFYYLDPTDSYRYFRESKDVNYYDYFFQKAYKAHKKSKGEMSIKGEAFDLYYKLINNPETINSVYVLTARAHSQAEVFAKLKNDRDQRKLIAKTVSDDELRSLAQRHYMLMRPEFLHYHNRMGVPSLSALKAGVISDLALALLRSHPTKYVERLHPNGEFFSKGVNLVLLEDRYENLKAMHESLQDIVNRHYGLLKVTVHNAGRPEDIELLEKPKTYVMTAYNHERELASEEIDAYLKLLLKAKSKNLNLCAKNFGGK